MQLTSPMKVGAAFLAGIVVALGGAIIYVRSSEFKPAEPSGKSTLQITPLSKEAAAPPELPESKENAEPKAESAGAKSEPPAAPARQSAPVFIPSAKPRVTRRPVSLAVAKAKPASTPAENGDTRTVAQNAPVAYPPAQDAPAMAPPPISDSPVVSQPQPHTVTLAEGTEVAIRLSERLSTDHSYQGDTFRAALDKPIVLDGFIIAEKGSKVLGHIVKAQKPGKLSGMAELSIALTELNTTDGQRVRIETNESMRKGPSNTNEEVLKMGGGAALGAIIGAIAGGGKGAAIGAGAGGAAGTGAVLLGHGKPAVIDSETRLTFQLASATTITERLN